MNFSATLFNKAKICDMPMIMQIISDAILKRKLEGSDQWQDGYPNEAVIENDINSSNGYVLKHDDKILSYAAVMFQDDPAYNHIDGKWLNNEPYVVIHRLAVSQNQGLKGIGTFTLQQIEKMVKESTFTSIKVDTNYDNLAMLSIFKKLHYTFCGIVSMRNGTRKAFQKIISS